MLKNLVGLVTGGASGLGKAAARTLIQEGCKIIICDLPNSPGMETASSLGQNASFAPMDIRSVEEVDITFSQVMRKYNKINFVVNCAGISCAHKIYNSYKKRGINMSTVERVVNTNLVGTINVIQTAARYICQNEEDVDGITGVIVNTAGVEAYEGLTGQVVIAATSGGIISMTQPLTQDLNSIGIRVVCICVGIFDTPMFQSMPDNVKAHMAKSCALPKRFGTAEDFGHAVKFALENRYMNGSVIRLDAGLKHYF